MVFDIWLCFFHFLPSMDKPVDWEITSSLTSNEIPPIVTLMSSQEATNCFYSLSSFPFMLPMNLSMPPSEHTNQTADLALNSSILLGSSLSLSPPMIVSSSLEEQMKNRVARIQSRSRCNVPIFVSIRLTVRLAYYLDPHRIIRLDRGSFEGCNFFSGQSFVGLAFVRLHLDSVCITYYL